MDGVLNINKPAGMTSHDVVDQLRRLLHEKKAGHTGTLDPDATGVLPVCLGKATKIIQFLPDNEKGYKGTISLGVVTDTLDASGRILGTSDSSHVDQSTVKSILGNFVGELNQIPPMVSAIKIRGERLYKIARQGRTVPRAPRKICIYDLELLDFYRERDSQSDSSSSSAKIDFRVRCSRGTYIRTLAADIGDALGCGAHLSLLTRTRSGIFGLEDSIPFEEIQADPGNASQSTRSMDDVLSFMPGVIISCSAKRRFLNGAPVSGSEVVCHENGPHEDDLVRVRDESRTLLGIGRVAGVDTPTTALDPQTMTCKVVRVLK